ncbi:MAG: ATP synthase F1 subunit epsilon [Pseudomonadota bacterium]|nr:ATP synthase F1 subunit epsilon [Pseudomonadota bacterium]
MQLSIITPEATLFSAEADMVTIPGTEGEFGVLPGHAPLISSIRPGVITIDAQGKKRRIAVVDGFAEVTPERCTVLAETAMDAEGISAVQAQARIDEARRRLELTETDEARIAAEKHLALAEALKFAVGEPLFE